MLARKSDKGLMDKLADNYADSLPSNERVLAFTEQDSIFSLSDYLDFFDSPIKVTLAFGKSLALERKNAVLKGCALSESFASYTVSYNILVLQCLLCKRYATISLQKPLFTPHISNNTVNSSSHNFYLTLPFFLFADDFFSFLLALFLQLLVLLSFFFLPRAP